MKIRITVLLVIVLLLGAMPMTVYGESKPHSLLLIGDSNIEYGPIANGYADLLRAVSGDNGTGYVPLNASFTNLAKTGIQITSDAGWIGGDMNVNGRHANGPFFAPNGLWVECSVAGAKLTVTFEGSGIDLYYAAVPGGGVYEVVLDGVDKGKTDTTASKAATKKLSFSGLNVSVKHTLQITLVSGKVILCGVDCLKGTGSRAVVHNWGNNSADTIDFTAVDDNVMKTAVKELNPDAIVVLLGTNDVLALDEKQFADNLTKIVRRLQQATDAPVMIISHFRIFREYDVTKHYLSYSWPTVSKETGCTYWNMYAWYGDGVASLRESSDGVHCNAEGGRRIAEELYKQVDKMLNPQAPSTKAPSTTTMKPATTTTSAVTTTKISDLTTQVEDMTTTAEENTVTTIPGAMQADTGEDTEQKSDGGFPVWAIIILAVTVLALAGIVGFFLIRKS